MRAVEAEAHVGTATAALKTHPQHAGYCHPAPGLRGSGGGAGRVHGAVRHVRHSITVGRTFGSPDSGHVQRRGRR